MYNGDRGHPGHRHPRERCGKERQCQSVEAGQAGELGRTNQGRLINKTVMVISLALHVDILMVSDMGFIYNYIYNIL